MVARAVRARTPTLATGARTRKRRATPTGFTLVEMMVVLVVMGLLASAVLLTLPSGGADLSRETERLAARLARAREEAILVNRQVRATLTASRYGFEVRGAGGEWRPLAQPPFGDQPWNDRTQVEFDSAGVVFEPTGQAAPTRIILTRDRRSSTVSVDIAGNVRIDGPQSL